MNYFYDKYSKKLTKKGKITIGVLLLLLLIFIFGFYVLSPNKNVNVDKVTTVEHKNKITKKNNQDYINDILPIPNKEKEVNNDETLFNKYNKKFNSKFIKQYTKMLDKYCSDSQGYFNTDHEAQILDLNDDGSICDGNEIQEKNAEKVAKLEDIKDFNKKNEITQVLPPENKEVVPENVVPNVVSTVDNNSEQIVQKPITFSTNTSNQNQNVITTSNTPNITPKENIPKDDIPKNQTLEKTFTLTINNNVKSTYQIKNIDTNNTIIKDSNSNIEVELPKGKYEINQLKVVDGYILNTEIKSIEIIDNNVNISFINNKVIENTNETLIIELKNLIKESQLDKKSKIYLLDFITKSVFKNKYIFEKVENLVTDDQLKLKIKYLERKI